MKERQLDEERVFHLAPTEARSRIQETRWRAAFRRPVGSPSRCREHFIYSGNPD